MKLYAIKEAKVPMQDDIIPWQKIVTNMRQNLGLSFIFKNDVQVLLSGGYSGHMDEMMTAIEKHFPEVGDMGTDQLLMLFLRKVGGLTPLEAKLTKKQLDAENL